ncbi:MAG: hypothetical protein HKO82_11665 [Acidimicrobiia bacterium]|nr:DUF1801 domain-containing protein [Acidimicrobiia bacterium]MBT8248208.1 DUF1801 domain-containing protein [Acidimicrobiia bacterium]NNL14327.1 hypothetical protein [Acidimicrobiia bacterium]
MTDDMTVDEYLENAPEPHRTTLCQIRESLRNILPEATEGLSYGVPAFMIDGTPVAGYAYFKNHCGFYPHSGSVLASVADELADYDWAKGTLRFPIDAPLPHSLLARLVEARTKQMGT